MALWCILLLISGGCGEQKKDITSLDDLKNVKIGAMTGSTGEQLSLARFPKATTKSFDDIMDAIAAIKSNQIDGVITSYPTALNICKHNQNLCLIHEPVDYEDTAIAVRKNEKELLASLNQIINELEHDGTLDDLKKRWLKTDMSPYEEKEFDLPKEGNVLTVGTAATREPICFINGKNEVSGFDGELARIISVKLGRPIVFKDMTFSALIPALMSGKVDVIITGMTATDERRKSVDFTTPYYKNSQVMIVRKPKGAEKASEKIPDEGAKSGTKAITSLDDLKHVKIGAMTGSTGERLSLARFPMAETKSFDDIMDAVAAMNANQLDAVIISDPTALNICKHNQNLCLIHEPLDKENIAIAVRKNEKDLLASLNNLIKDLKNDGTLDDLKKRWFKTDTSPYEEKEFVLPKEGNVLTIGTSATSEPFCFINGKNEVSGLDGELARIISMKLGRPIVFKDMTFSALIPALLSGKVDVVISGMTATEERSKSVDFTTSYYQESQVVIVKKPSEAETASGNTSKDESLNSSFFQSVKDGFYNNLIREERYLLIVNGLTTTVIISIFATIFGTLLGALVCFMRMSRNKLVNTIAAIYISVLRGTPVLVLLMITFYVIFASVNIDPVIVAVIAFGLNFAAYVSEMFRAGIEGVEGGQTEAGIAMGFSKLKTFIYIVMPQATRRILPIYKGEFISLIKMTSVVGYIAVQDLTKASDIIRSRTFDAFFPLVMVAVLYYLISWVLMLALGYVERMTDPKLRTRKGR